MLMRSNYLYTNQCLQKLKTTAIVCRYSLECASMCLGRALLRVIVGSQGGSSCREGHFVASSMLFVQYFWVLVELWSCGTQVERGYTCPKRVFGCRLSGPGCRQHSFAPAINFGIQKISSFSSKEGIWCLRFFVGVCWFLKPLKKVVVCGLYILKKRYLKLDRSLAASGLVFQLGHIKLFVSVKECWVVSLRSRSEWKYCSWFTVMVLSEDRIY